MRRVALAVAAPVLGALLLLPLAGCVSRTKFKENEALLAECRTDKVSAQTAMTSCEERFAREVKRWEDIDAVVASIIPVTLTKFRAKHKEGLNLLQETTREEVGRCMDQFTDAMGRGFQVLRDQNESTGLQLEVAQTKLDALQARADNIGTQTSTINETLDGSLRSAVEEQRRMRQEAIALISTVQTFDQTYVSVKEGKNRLKLNRNQRETIEQFHARLIGQLTALGGGAAANRSAGAGGGARRGYGVEPGGLGRGDLRPYGRATAGTNLSSPGGGKSSVRPAPRSGTRPSASCHLEPVVEGLAASPAEETRARSGGSRPRSRTPPPRWPPPASRRSRRSASRPGPRPRACTSRLKNSWSPVSSVSTPSSTPGPATPPTAAGRRPRSSTTWSPRPIAGAVVVLELDHARSRSLPTAPLVVDLGAHAAGAWPRTRAGST